MDDRQIAALVAPSRWREELEELSALALYSAALAVHFVIGLREHHKHAYDAVGGVVLNVLKEELPGERCARLAPFVAGAASYTLVLQLV